MPSRTFLGAHKETVSLTAWVDIETEKEALKWIGQFQEITKTAFRKNSKRPPRGAGSI